MGAGEFHGRVRDGIGCRLPAMATRSSNPPSRDEDVKRFCCVRSGVETGRLCAELIEEAIIWIRFTEPGDDFHAWCCPEGQAVYRADRAIRTS